MSEVLVEAIGFAAAGLLLSGFLWRNPRVFLSISVVGLSLWVVHFAALGAWLGVLGASLALLRNGVGAWGGARLMRGAVAICILSTIALVLIGPEGPVALWAAAAGIVKATTVLWRDRPVGFRVAHIAGELLMLPYALALGSMALTSASLMALAVMGGTLWWVLRSEAGAPATP